MNRRICYISNLYETFFQKYDSGKNKLYDIKQVQDQYQGIEQNGRHLYLKQKIDTIATFSV